MDVRYSKPIELKTVDVFVAGGGPAGIAAAVTAARQGKKVLIVESTGCFGGAGTSGLVPMFCSFGNGVDFLAGGIGAEVCQAHFGECDSRDELRPIRVEELKRLYDKMIKDSGAEFLFFTSLTDVVCDREGHVDYVVCVNKGGLFAVKAGVYLDCTGDGDLCAKAGADFLFGDDDGLTMGSSLCQLWANIDWSRVLPNDDRKLEEAIADGVFQVPDRHLAGIYRVGETVGGGNVGHVFGVNSTDPRSLTDAMVEGRRYVADYHRFYREYLEGYEKVELVSTASSLSVRESRRIVGDYTMKLDDFIRRASFEDEIGRYNYKVDIHESKPTLEDHEKFKETFHTLWYYPGESYGIPYRALIPKKLSNVLVAGRCISADRPMQSSVRIMACCFITGQAIGMAGSMTADSGDVRSVSVPELQRRLAEMGAFLPNNKPGNGGEDR